MAKKKYYGGTINEDSSKHANLPTEVVISSYPTNESVSQDYNDTISGIDSNINQTVRGIRKQKSNKKY